MASWGKLSLTIGTSTQNCLHTASWDGALFCSVLFCVVLLILGDKTSRTRFLDSSGLDFKKPPEYSVLLTAPVTLGFVQTGLVCLSWRLLVLFLLLCSSTVRNNPQYSWWGSGSEFKTALFLSHTYGAFSKLCQLLVTMRLSLVSLRWVVWSKHTVCLAAQSCPTPATP